MQVRPHKQTNKQNEEQNHHVLLTRICARKQSSKPVRREVGKMGSPLLGENSSHFDRSIVFFFKVEYIAQEEQKVRRTENSIEFTKQPIMPGNVLTCNLE